MAIGCLFAPVCSPTCLFAPLCSLTYLFADMYVRNAYLIAIQYALHNTVYVNIYYVTTILCYYYTSVFLYDINLQNPRCARKACTMTVTVSAS